jgi:tRNA A37 threonylcarbamoyladenosine modification protein TsaB|tara:strand:+ start:769 stop:1155 length:387 start_codon:yes stop_codon:yes gene_type:complete
MNSLIVDATGVKIFFTLIVDKNLYTCSYENSKINFEKFIMLISDFLKINNSSLKNIDTIYVNRGPGSFAGIRNSLATIKALHMTREIDYYCYSFEDFELLNGVKSKDVPHLCKKFKIKKNLIKPIYLS